MLHRRTNHRCSAFWPQCAGALATIKEGVHLLTHHIGAFADAPGKQFGDLQQGRADLLDASAAEMLAGHRLHRLPAPGLFRQQIHHAAQALQLTHTLPA